MLVISFKMVGVISLGYKHYLIWPGSVHFPLEFSELSWAIGSQLVIVSMQKANFLISNESFERFDEATAFSSLVLHFRSSFIS